MAYAKRYKAQYTAIFWVNANDQDSIKLSFVDISRQILEIHPSTVELATVDIERNLHKVVEVVKGWLGISKNTRWLLIYDNYDNPIVHGNADLTAVDIRQFLPGCDHGSIIITTRSSQVTIGTRMHVQKLQKLQEGLEILSNASGRKDITDDSSARALVEELDRLPLALSTAGAYLEQVTTSFSEYLRLYKASWLKLQMTSPQLRSYEDRSLCTTWQLSFSRIKQQNESSANLLKLWAYFDRQDLWFEILRHRKSADCDWLHRLTEDEICLNEAIRVLRDYGFIEPEFPFYEQSGSMGYTMHSCVHSWTVFVLNREWDESLAKLALSCVASMVPGNNAINWWLSQQRLLQHAARCEYLIVHGKIETPGMEWALHSLGILYKNQDKLGKAEEMYIRALQGRKKTLGLAHTSTLETINNLGLLYADQGKLEKAEQMYMRALQGYEQTLGPKHTSTLDTVNNLGLLYMDQGKLSESEQIYIRALQGREEIVGPKHISTLQTVGNLGILYADQGKTSEAEKMYLRALQGYKEVLGPKHTLTLQTLGNLGILYADHGEAGEAEKMFIQTLRGYEQVLGPRHILTLRMIENLGTLYADQGKMSEAEKMYMRALQGYEEALGPKHISTLNAVNRLSKVYVRRCLSSTSILFVDPYLQQRHSAANSNIIARGLYDLVDLYVKYPATRASQLGRIGRLLVWSGRDKEPIIAFRSQLSLTTPLHHAICDGCKLQMNINMGRFVCRVCEDIDLCECCYVRSQKRELSEILPTCSNHAFLDISNTGTEVQRKSFEG